MATVTADKKNPSSLEAFFTMMESRSSAGANVAERPDVFAQIIEALDKPEEGEKRATTAETGTKLARKTIAEEQKKLAGAGGAADYLEMLREAHTRPGAHALSVVFKNACVVVLMLVILYAGYYSWTAISREWSQRSEEQAQTARERADFFKAGWRASEPIYRNRGNFEQPTTTEVAYLREIAPDDGRVLLKVTDTGEGSYTFELSGWTRTDALRSLIIDEIVRAFPFQANPATTKGIIVRPQGGKLAEDEARVIQPQTVYTEHGKLIDRIQYGESGYVAADADKATRTTSNSAASNIVTGRPPGEGAPYIYVIGGGGNYWKTGGQRATVLQAAFDRLKKAPDGGKGARAIWIVYQEGDSVVIDKVPIAATGTAGSAQGTAPTQQSIVAGQSSNLTWTEPEKKGSAGPEQKGTK